MFNVVLLLEAFQLLVSGLVLCLCHHRMETMSKRIDILAGKK